MVEDGRKWNEKVLETQILGFCLDLEVVGLHYSLPVRNTGEEKSRMRCDFRLVRGWTIVLIKTQGETVDRGVRAWEKM